MPKPTQRMLNRLWIQEHVTFQNWITPKEKETIITRWLNKLERPPMTHPRYMLPRRNTKKSNA